MGRKISIAKFIGGGLTAVMFFIMASAAVAGSSNLRYFYHTQ